jgi:hypothetical protein
VKLLDADGIYNLTHFDFEKLHGAAVKVVIPCPDLTWDVQVQGFIDDFDSKIRTILGVSHKDQGNGIAISAPVHDTPGDNYFYHWMRNAAFSYLICM